MAKTKDEKTMLNLAGKDKTFQKNAANDLYKAIEKSAIINMDFVQFNTEEKEKVFIKTGITKFDEMLGGGVPLGVMAEIFGKEGTGKSTLCYHIAKAFQKAGGYVLAIDTEHSWDTARFVELGGDKETLIKAEADTVEQVFNLLIKILDNQVKKTGTGKESPCLIIIDTIAGAPLAAEQAAILKGDEFYDMGKKAKYLSTMLRQLPRLIGATRTAVLFVNQVRQTMGGNNKFADPDISTGGYAIKFYASWRLKLRNAGKVKSGETVIGQKIKMETIKCKTAPPRQQLVLNLLFDKGEFDQLASILQLLKENKLIRKTRGGWKILDDDFAKTFDLEESYKTEDEDSFLRIIEDNFDKISSSVLGTPTKQEDDNNGEGNEEESVK